MPTLITLAASLPQFQHPFTMTSVPPNRFQTGVASNEDALDKARSCFMEGMYLLNEVSLRMKKCSEELSKRQVVFDKALEGLKQLRVLHKQTEKDAKELKEEVVGLSERNRSLVVDLIRSIGQQEELKKLNQDLQIRINDALGLKELEGVSQQYHSLKSQYTEKVSQLEIPCSSKDAIIKLLEEDLATPKLLMLERDAQIATLNDA
ncbi:hypothetical protein Lser_V15G06816 [Lactuca serriola]